MKQKPHDTWAEDWLDFVLGLVPAGATPPTTAFKPQPWTVLKLIALAWYAPMYLRILRRFGYTDIAFVDLYSGAGLSQYSKEGVSLVLPGSSLIAASPRADRTAKAGSLKFDRLILVEGKEELLESARALLGPRGFTVGVNLETILGDPAECAERVCSLLRGRKGGHALLFVDPETLDFRFDELRGYLNRYPATDVLYLHLVSGEARADGQESARHAASSTQPVLPVSRDAAATALEKSLKDLGRRVVRIRIQAGSLAPGYYYDLVFATRLTGSGSQYADALQELADRFTRIKGDTMEKLLRTRTPIREAGRLVRQQRLDA